MTLQPETQHEAARGEQSLTEKGFVGVSRTRAAAPVILAARTPHYKSVCRFCSIQTDLDLAVVRSFQAIKESGGVRGNWGEIDDNGMLEGQDVSGRRDIGSSYSQSRTRELATPEKATDRTFSHGAGGATGDRSHGSVGSICRLERQEKRRFGLFLSQPSETDKHRTATAQ